MASETRAIPLKSSSVRMTHFYVSRRCPQRKGCRHTTGKMRSFTKWYVKRHGLADRFPVYNRNGPIRRARLFRRFAPTGGLRSPSIRPNSRHRAKTEEVDPLKTI